MGAIWSKIFSSGVGELTNGIGNIIDTAFTSKEERDKAKIQMSQIITKFTTDITQAKAEVIKTEITGNWLQRSWRPILMLAFGFIIIYEYFISKIFNLPTVDLPSQFWSLLELGIGGYVIGRSAEKIAGKYTDNITINKRKK